MTQAQQRKLFASVNHLWGSGIAEYLLYSIMIVRYGKCSIKGLTQTEVDEIFTWLEGLENASN